MLYGFPMHQFKGHTLARCWQVLEENSWSIYLQEKTEMLLTKITSRRFSLVEGSPGTETRGFEIWRKTKLCLVLEPGQREQECEIVKPHVNLKVHLIGSCASPPLSITLLSTFPLSSSSVALVQLWRPFLLLTPSAGQNGKPAAYY